jgi:anti-sigma regulatory factor (Ser/Thr protein kinase)
MVKVERIENRQLLLATDSALLNMIDHKLKHNKNDTMTLQYSSDDKKCEQQIKTRAESRLQQKRMSDQQPIEIFCFNYLRM